ncbi:TolC family protein [Maribellus maritimus]|uniref:TolC family protein n=1 Tax=Maribellus maritimus TaxID=2870838 RepID=UPI001EEA9AE1|nr:TolC family protein [Maribellus maritimus]MCG6189009.1 TolC family protein [Maribellus maritimus]
MKKIVSILILFVFTGFVALAQQPLSLNKAVERALENNYQMKIIRGEQQIAEIQNNWGNAGRYPYMNLSLADNNSYNISEGENTTVNRFTGGASLNWTLFDGWSVRIAKQRFEELEQLSKQNTAIMVESTIQSVILSYYTVLLEKEKLEVYREVMSLSEDRYRQAEERKAFGTFVTYDVLQAQNSYLSDRAGFMLQEVAYKNALRDLNYLMAENGNVAYNLTDSFEAIPVDYSLAELGTQMFENNKSLQNQYVNQRLLENAVASAKSAFSPSLDFSGGANGNSARTAFENSGTNWANSASFYGNFTLSFNLFSGGNRKRALQIAKIDEEVGTVEIGEMQHDLTNSLSNLFEFYQVRKELLDVANENLQAAKLNLQISREKFEAGAINSFNFRDVQNIYLNAAQQRLEAIYNFIDSHTALLRLTGTIIQEYE